MKETQLYPEVERALKAVFLMKHTIKVPGSTYNIGIPDFVLTDAVVEVKVKRKGRKAEPTALQQVNLDAVAKKGGLGICLVFEEDTKEWYATTAEGLGETKHYPRHELPELLAYLRDEGGTRNVLGL